MGFHQDFFQQLDMIQPWLSHGQFQPSEERRQLYSIDPHNIRGLRGFDYQEKQQEKKKYPNYWWLIKKGFKTMSWVENKPKVFLHMQRVLYTFADKSFE